MYYSKKLVASHLTLFIGGNHEVSQYLSENYNGALLCPNIYFMGYSNVFHIAKGCYRLSIGGFSGIYQQDMFNKLYAEFPITNHKINTENKIRDHEIAKLFMIDKEIDIFMSHDWPRYIWKDNLGELLKKKPFFEEDIEKDRFANLGAYILLKKLKP